MMMMTVWTMEGIDGNWALVVDDGANERLFERGREGSREEEDIES